MHPNSTNMSYNEVKNGGADVPRPVNPQQPKYQQQQQERLMNSSRTTKQLRGKVSQVVQQPLWSYMNQTETTQMGLREFVTKTIKQRECISYVRENHEKNNCCCGRDKRWHKERDLISKRRDSTSSESALKWTLPVNTKRSKCNAYGELMFSGFGNRSVGTNLSYAPYIRLDCETSPEHIWKLMYEIWQVPAPKMVVSVTGGAQKFYIPRKLREAFKQGLSNVATTTDAWIITGGTATGVMQFVGEAMKECRLSSEQKQIVCIGIATWGVVDNQQALECSPGVEGNFPSIYHLRDCQFGHRMLDHNHTHFLLADDGTYSKYGGEVELRAKFQEHVRTKCTACLHARGEHPGACVSTPVVLIVCEGGAKTVSTVVESLECNTPCVIMKGSGRAADVLCTAYKASKPRTPDEKYHMSPGFKLELYDAVSKQGLCRNPTPKEINACVEELEKCIRHRDLITIYEADDNANELDKAILRALLTAYQKDVQCQIDLALIWNRADIAREDIFSLDNRPRWQNISLERVMHDALLAARNDFVQLFIDNGLHPGEFLTARRLRELYKTCLEDNSSTLAVIHRQMIRGLGLYDDLFTMGKGQQISDEDSAKVRLLPVMGRILSLMLHGKISAPYENIVMMPRGSVHHALHNAGLVTETTAGTQTTHATKISQKGQALRPEDSRSNRSRHNSNESDTRHHRSRSRSKSDWDDTDSDVSQASETSSVRQHKLFKKKQESKVLRPASFQYAERELFLWALMFNRQPIAWMFWNIAPDPIGGALIASHLLKTLSEHAARLEETDLSADLKAQAKTQAFTTATNSDVRQQQPKFV